MKIVEYQSALNKAVLEDSKGFTLLEILVALSLGIVLITAICVLVIDQVKTHEDHQMKVMMQQNGRAAMTVMSNELMLAGYGRHEFGNPTVTYAGIDRVSFVYITDNGAAQFVDYSYIASEDRIGRRHNSIVRTTLLRDVAAFRILYAYDAEDIGSGNSGYGILEKDPDESRTIWAYSSKGDGPLDLYYTLNDDETFQGEKSLSVQPTLDRVRAVKIWLLMRSTKRKSKKMSEADFGVLPGESVKGLDTDNYSYRLFTTTVKMRNMYY